jgi:hypothetical protein
VTGSSNMEDVDHTTATPAHFVVELGLLSSLVLSEDEMKAGSIGFSCGCGHVRCGI